MVSLARKMLRHEWRRFLPAALAVAFCGVLLVVQGSLVLGIFSTASVYVSASSADLWFGYPGTQSVELGRPIPQIAELRARMEPAVERVERFQWLDGDWRGPADHGGVSVFITGIDPRPDGLLFSRLVSPALRARLLEPDTFLVDLADRDKLGVHEGASGELNGHRVRLAGTVRGVRALGGVNIITSLQTAHTLGAPGPGSRSMTYLLAKLREGDQIAPALSRLRAGASPHRYAIWTRDEFSQRAIAFWLLDTGAGLGFLFAAAVVVLVGVTITSQTMMSVIGGSIREYATLRALGVARADLRRVVLEQAAWIGGLGVATAAILSAVVIALAQWQFVPVAVTPSMALLCAGLVIGVALISGAAAGRSLRNADPALLLR
ncbi:MAG: ABC transporter permease [Gammaproteobacteria bacterium]